MKSSAARIEQILRAHALYAWDAEAVRLIEGFAITSTPAAQLSEARRGMHCPADIPFDPAIAPQSVDCFGRRLTMLHPFELSDFADFEPVADAPWLWRNRHGALMPAFNLTGFVERFIDGGEERAIAERDRHGRLPLTASTLHRLGVAHQPLRNVYLFAVLASAKANALEPGTAAVDPSVHVLPPVLVLSHDCDQLRGNDFFTQAARAVRLLTPMARLRAPALANLRHIVENAVHPRRHFFDDALAMARAIQDRGFRSAYYFLNGAGGRLGARSGSAIIAEFASRLPDDAEVGVHYNYGYSSDLNLLRRQIDEIEMLTGRKVRSGRAHYLRFDPERDFEILAQVGLGTDESLGFPESNGFRVGFAGAYLAGGSGVVELPLQFMDTNTVPRGDDFDVLRICEEIESTGGVVTLLFHPGSFNTPEALELQGLYETFLDHFRLRAYRPMLPSELGDLVRTAGHPGAGAN